MYVDACAIIAVLSDEKEAERVSAALAGSPKRLTSPVAILEAVAALARPDKFDLPVMAVEAIVMEYLDERGIEIRDLPPPKRATALAVSAADKSGQAGTNSTSAIAFIMHAPNIIGCRSSPPTANSATQTWKPFRETDHSRAGVRIIRDGFSPTGPCSPSPLPANRLPVRAGIEALLMNGPTQRFIAKRYKTTPANLSNWIKKHGLKKPNP